MQDVEIITLVSCWTSESYM